MNEEILFANWYVGLVIAIVIILVAATLLLLVWNSARRILRLALSALRLVVQIKENTNCIWALKGTNQVAINISTGAKQIATHAGMVATALHESETI